MTGPEHYHEAEVIATLGERCDYGCPHSGCQHEMAQLARAQVHATLAHAAAVIDTGNGTIKPSDLHEWRKAIDEDYAAECAAEVTRDGHA